MIWARIEISKERTIVLQMNILWIISISQVFDCWLVCSNIWNCEEKSPNFEMVCGTIRSCLIWKFQSIMRRVRKSLASSIADINRTRALNWTIYARFSGCRTKSFHFFCPIASPLFVVMNVCMAVFGSYLHCNITTFECARKRIHRWCGNDATETTFPAVGCWIEQWGACISKVSLDIQHIEHSGCNAQMQQDEPKKKRKECEAKLYTE